MPTDWSPNGTSVVYHAPTPEHGFDLSAWSLAPLFKTGLGSVDPYRMDYVPSADGKRILVSTRIGTGDSPAITVVLNWPALLKK